MQHPIEARDSSPTTQPWILVLGTADWNQAIATNQHYMVRELAATNKVTFVESMGLRRPQLSRRDLKRIWARLSVGNKVIQSRRDIPLNCEVVSPLVVPLHGGPVRRLNQYLLRKQLEGWLLHTGPRILWTYSPVTYGFESCVESTVYHCVDLLGEFPGISRDLVHSGEKTLSKHRVQAIGSSNVVVGHLEEIGFRGVLSWPNVADVAQILASRPKQSQRRERAIFAGNLSAAKVDFLLIDQLLARGVEVHLAGPIAEGGGDSAAQVAELISNGAVYHGLLPLEGLAELYWTATVGIIPYLINDYTRGVNPLKTFEYLAAGLKVVSTPVPAVDALHRHVSVADSRTLFVEEVVNSMRSPQGTDESERISIALANSWEFRGQQGRELVSGLLRDTK